MAAWICKKCSDSGYILRVELRALADKMHMVHEKKRMIKMVVPPRVKKKKKWKKQKSWPEVMDSQRSLSAVLFEMLTKSPSEDVK